MLHEVIFARTLSNDESNKTFINLRPRVESFEASATDFLWLQKPAGYHVVQHFQIPQYVLLVASLVHENMQLVEIVPNVGILENQAYQLWILDETLVDGDAVVHKIAG